MKPSGILFLVIAIMYSPQEKNCVKIINNGFQQRTRNSRYCFTSVTYTGQLILDEGETLDNIPPRIILQFKCPFDPDKKSRYESGSTDGRWFLFLHKPVNLGALPKQTGTILFTIKCWPSKTRTYQMETNLRTFFFIKNCSMRFFLGEIENINHSSIITNDHGLNGFTREVPLMEFRESPYYNATYDFEFKRKYSSAASHKDASDRQRPTDALLIFCGLAVASAVLSF